MNKPENPLSFSCKKSSQKNNEEILEQALKIVGMWNGIGPCERDVAETCMKLKDKKTASAVEYLKTDLMKEFPKMGVPVHVRLEILTKIREAFPDVVKKENKG